MIKEKSKLLVEDENQIMGVKLVTGEDIMAKVIDHDAEFVEVVLPHALTASGGGAAFMAWPSMVSEDNIFIAKDKILLTYPLRVDFYSQYASMHGVTVDIPSEEESGIFMPAEKKLIS